MSSSDNNAHGADASSLRVPLPSSSLSSGSGSTSPSLSLNSTPPSPQLQLLPELQPSSASAANVSASADHPSSSSSLPDVALFWRSFDLEGKRLLLDKQGMEMSSLQEATAATRKALAESTKIFRRAGVADKLKQIGGLLREYQQDIDRLTRRARFSENAFLDLYKELYEAPDPSRSLAAAHAQIEKAKTARLDLLKAKTENSKLKAEIEEYESEISNLKNQDITIRKLERKIAECEKGIESKIESAVNAREAQLEEDAEHQLFNASRERAVLETRILDADASISELQRQLDGAQTTIFELRSQQEEKDAASLAERTIIAEDEQRNAASVASLERENKRLQEELLAERSGTGGFAAAGSLKLEDMTQRCNELRNRVSERDESIRSLEDQVSAAKRKLEQAKAEFQSHESKTVERISRADARITGLVRELEKRPTAEAFRTLQADLQLLRDAEFDANDEEKEDRIVSAEDIVVSKLRRTRTELTQMRVKLRRTETELSDARSALLRTEEERDDHKQLAEKLEVEATVMRRTDSSTAEDPTTGGDQSAELLQSILHTPGSRSGASPTGTGLGSGSTPMLSILQEQRDRFRTRMLVLENENEKLKSATSEDVKTMRQLRQDNVKLYEKIKYLQAYKGGASGRLNPNQRSEVVLNIGSENEVEKRYGSLYAAQSNPFQSFSRTQERKRYKNLSAVERFTLDASRFFLANKYTRSFLFFYGVALHTLVIATIYLWEHARC